MAEIILFGLTKNSELLHFYLSNDTAHRVVAFTVDEKYMKEERFCNLPVVAFEKVESMYSPQKFRMGIFLGITDVNRLRERKYNEAKAKGYQLITYISSKASIWPGTEVGENSFIFEQTTIMPFTKVGNDVFIAPGCVIGHHSSISDHCFVSAHAVLLGSVSIGRNCIIGANATIKDRVTVADCCVIGAGADIMKNTEYGQVYVGKQPILLAESSDRLRSWVTWSVRKAKPTG